MDHRRHVVRRTVKLQLCATGSIYLLLASSAGRGPSGGELATVRNITNAACPPPGTVCSLKQRGMGHEFIIGPICTQHATDIAN